jgi:EXLDI family protein
MVTIRILTHTSNPQVEGYDAPVPNKTIYVSDGDLPLYQRAQELAGGNLSAAISKALRRYVETEEGLRAGFDQITVKVGIGSKRKVRFVGALVGEWMDTTGSLVETFRVYRGRSGKYVLHVERSPEYWALGDDGKPAGWRAQLGMGHVRYGSRPGESLLEVYETLEELRDHVPADLFAMLERSARQPALEDLDI